MARPMTMFPRAQERGGGAGGESASPDGGRRIQEGEWYSDRDVLLILDINRDAQQKAREAGRLQFIERGGTYLYKGEWILAWLNAADSSQPQQTDRGAQRRTVPRRAAGVSPQQPTKAATSSPPVRINHPQPQPASQPTSLPVSKGQAPMTENEANQTIQQFNTAVQTVMRERKCERRAAVRAVCKSNPQLHRDYLLATNRGRSRQVIQGIADMYD